MALAALEQALIQAREKPVDKSKAIATCLAYLYSLQPCERWPFDEFWKWLDYPDATMRSANLSRSLNGICVQLDIDRVKRRKIASKTEVTHH
jgi:hypothetical protein